MASDEDPSAVAAALATTGGGGEQHRPGGHGAHQPPSTMSKTRMKKDARRKKLEEKMRNLETTRLLSEERERKIQRIKEEWEAKTSGRGIRSSNDGKEWKCRCGRVNQPIQYRFFDVPRLHCKSCKKQFNGKFKFCLGEIEVEGGSLIGEVQDQKLTRKCVAYSYSKAEEISERVFNVNHGKDPNEVECINPDELQEEFDTKWPIFSDFDSLVPDYGLSKIVLMGLIFKEEGIAKDKSGDICKIEDLSTIPRDDFEEITRCLASGIPFVGTYCTGKRRGALRYCQIYKSPCRLRGFGKRKSPSGSQASRKSKSPSRSKSSRKSKSRSRSQRRKKYYGHAVVIIGAGMKFGRRFFYFLSSWSKKFCARRNKWGQIVRGGIGKIRASDLTKNLVKISQPHMTGLKRRLEAQSSPYITEFNYLLMTETKRHMTIKKALDARSDKRDKDFENFEEGSLSDPLIYGEFCDDEASYPKYTEDRYLYRGKAHLGNLQPNQHSNPSPSIGSDSTIGTLALNSNPYLNPWSTDAMGTQGAKFVGLVGNTRTSDADAVGGLSSTVLKSLRSVSGGGLCGLDSADFPKKIGSSDSSISSQILQDQSMLQSIMSDPELMNKITSVVVQVCNYPHTGQGHPSRDQLVVNQTSQDGNNGVSGTGTPENVGLGVSMSRLNVLGAGAGIGVPDRGVKWSIINILMLLLTCTLSINN